MAASRDLIRSRHQQAVAGRRQPPEATQSRALDATRVATILTNTQVMAGSNPVIELPHQPSRRSHYQPVPTRKLSHRCGTKTEPCWPNKSMKPWLMGRLQCTVVH
jgi:hypothetical protein